jgi:uncharacterized protein YhaN
MNQTQLIVTDMALSQLINANTQNSQLAEALRKLATYIDNGQRTVNRFKADAAQAEADLTNATTTIDALMAERAQLTAQLTQLRSQTIAREDWPEAQHDYKPLPEGVVLGPTVRQLHKLEIIQNGDLQWLPNHGIWGPVDTIGHVGHNDGMFGMVIVRPVAAEVVEPQPAQDPLTELLLKPLSPRSNPPQ